MMAKPKEKLVAGNCSAAIWVNVREINGEKRQMLSVSFQKSYKDKDGNWKNTDSFGVNDLPKLGLLVGEAFGKCLRERDSLLKAPENAGDV